MSSDGLEEKKELLHVNSPNNLFGILDMPGVSVLPVSEECAFSTPGWDRLSQHCRALLGKSCLRAQHDSETKVLEAALAPVMAKQVKYGGLNDVK